MTIMRTVECTNGECANNGVPILLENDVGARVSCGMCGAVLAGQADWYQPPTDEELGIPPAPEQAADLINAMTTEERAALIALLGGPNEGETP